jgi:hypothetical protein
MKRTHILAAAILAASVSGAEAQQIQGPPRLSDGTYSIGVNTDGSGIAKITACGRDYWLPNQNAYDTYMSIRGNLQGAGYIWYRTTDQYKLYYACGWGMFDHLNDVFQ